MAKCRRCKDGRHGATCELRACDCFCRLPSVPYVREAALNRYREFPELREVWPVLRQHGVVVRFDPTTYAMLVRPRPENLPAHVQEVLQGHRMLLVKALFPHANDPRHCTREGWWTDGLAECVCCGKGTLWNDPLDVHRHPSCGWRGQRRTLVILPAIPRYPTIDAQGRRSWG